MEITEPGLLEKAYRLAKTMVKFAKSGWTLVSEEQHKARLEVCEPCLERRRNTCLACGCYLPAKAAMDIAECESKTGKNKWEAVDARFD